MIIHEHGSQTVADGKGGHGARNRQRWRRGCFLLAALGVASALLTACMDSPVAPGPPVASPQPELMTVAGGRHENVVLAWNQTLLDAVSAGALGPPMVARGLAIVHTAMFDAWAAYDEVARGTRLGSDLRRPPEERTTENRETAISYAAYRALVDLFPEQVPHFDARMETLGLDPGNTSQDISTPTGLGNVAAAAVLEFRHRDGANQLGDLGPSGLPYSDYTGYQPVNTPDDVIDLNRWQPLRHPDRTGALIEQRFLAPHWDRVTPFALASADQLRPPPPELHPHGRYRQQAEELIRMSASLTDREKMVVEYWMDGPNTVLPPGHFNLFAQHVSLREGHTLDDDIKLFFILTNAIHDAAIACWDAKIHYDYVRPITAIRTLKGGQRIRAWGGPGHGTQVIRGENWMPYQPDWFPTPPFAEYSSGHSTFSAAGAEILARFTGSDYFGASVTITEAPVGVEPGVPARPVTLSWETFSEAADEAGLSRRLGGIHFADGDLIGRAMGRAVAALAWEKAVGHIQGHRPPAVSRQVPSP
jgi:hypothetical protein